MLIMNNLISDISTFSLSLFGIGITIFTVIYSFISNKKEYMNEMNNVITSGKACPEEKAKFYIALKYIEIQKRNNSVILFISLFSLIIYILSLLYLRIFSESFILEIILIILFACLFMIFAFALSKFIITYLRYIH